jgi:hypothetical protein
MIPILIYTHSDYQDVLDLNLDCLAKQNIPASLVTIASDRLVNNIGNSILYNTSSPYATRLLESIKEYAEDIFIFLHEDFILYDTPNNKELLDLKKFLDTNKNIDFIRLIKTAEPIVLPGPNSNLYYTSNYFSIQATIFKKEYLLKYLSKYPNSSMWDLEVKGSENPNKGLYYFNNEPRRGSAHFDSSIFPYAATAIVKGKWNSEYKKELLQIRQADYFLHRGWTE